MRSPVSRACALAAALLLAGPAVAQDTWQVLPTGTTQDLRGVHFVSAETGYVAGASGTVLRTTDGGATWTSVSPPAAPDLNGVHFFTATEGVVVGAGGTILRTTDGGATWAPVASGTEETLWSVAFAGDFGLAGGSGQTILRSTSRGATWEVVQEGFFGGGFFGAHALSATHGYVAGQNSIFQPFVGYTGDGGHTFDFTPFYLNTNEGRLHDVHFLDAARGVVVGVTWDGQGAAARTTDGAQTWTSTLSAHPLEAVAFAGETGYAAGWDGALLKSTDGGQTWAPVTSGTSATLHDLSIPTNARAFAAGTGGTVLRGTLSTPTSTPGGPAPAVLALEASRPNPTVGEAVIRYHVPSEAPVALRVYDALGREVAVLAEGVRSPGTYEARFDASALCPGVYLGVLEAGGTRTTRRLLVAR